MIVAASTWSWGHSVGLCVVLRRDAGFPPIPRRTLVPPVSRDGQPQALQPRRTGPRWPPMVDAPVRCGAASHGAVGSRASMAGSDEGGDTRANAGPSPHAAAEAVEALADSEPGTGRCKIETHEASVERACSGRRPGVPQEKGAVDFEGEHWGSALKEGNTQAWRSSSVSEILRLFSATAMFNNCGRKPSVCLHRISSICASALKKAELCRRHMQAMDCVRARACHHGH